MIDIIIFAVLALLLFKFLKSILGEEYDDEPKIEKTVKDITGSAVRRSPTYIESNQDEEDIDEETKIAIKKEMFDSKYILPECVDNFKKLFNKEEDFSAKFFVKVAKDVVELISRSYNNQDEKALSALVEENLLNNFLNAINLKKQKGLKEEILLIGIQNIFICDVYQKIGKKFVALNLEYEQINYVLNLENKIVEGSETKINKVTEKWTFCCEEKDSHYTWLLHSIKTI